MISAMLELRKREDKPLQMTLGDLVTQSVRSSRDDDPHGKLWWRRKVVFF